jgi:hypothetical protein
MATVEKFEGFNFENGENGQSGKRTFLVSDNLVSTRNAKIPRIGERFPDLDTFARQDVAVEIVDVMENCLCRKVGVKLIADGQGRQLLVVADYNTKVQDDSGIVGGTGTIGDPQLDDMPREIGIVGESINVAAPGVWKWASDNVSIQTEGENAISLPVRIITGSLTITKVVEEFDILKYFSLVGRVNSEKFPQFEDGALGEGFGPGTWLLTGLNLEEFYDDRGNSKWRMKPNLIFRSPDGNPTVDDPRGWNDVWRPDKGFWDRPRHYTGTGFLYCSADLNELFRTDE